MRPLPLLRLLLPFALLVAGCRSVPPREGPVRAAPREPAPAPAPDPAVAETRRMEEQIESPHGGWQHASLPTSPEPAAEPGTVELEFAPGATTLTTPSRVRLEALAERLLGRTPPAELELLATPEDGSGSEAERRLLRRRLEEVSERLRSAGVGRSMLLVDGAVWHADGAESGVPLEPRRVFVIVRAP